MRFLVLTVLLLGTWGYSAAQPQTPSAAFRREFLQKFVAAAVERTHHAVRYDPAYIRIPYPGGDVPAETGGSVRMR